MVIAIFLSLSDFSWSKLPWSARFLLLLALVMVVTVFLNWDSYHRPWKAVFKTRYFIIGALSVIPLSVFWDKFRAVESLNVQLRKLIFFLFLAANLASLSGLTGYFTGFNPLRMENLEIDRNTGTFGSVMAYAHSLAWLSLLFINFWVHRKKLNVGLPDWYLVFSIVLSLEGLFTTHTRGAMLAWFVGCLAINRKIAFSGLVFFILSFWGSSYLDMGFVSKHVVRSGSNEERLGSWLGAIEAFKEHPVLGVGYLNYDTLSREIKERHGLPAAYFQGNAHNDFLELLAGVGFLGFIVFLTWISFWMRETYQAGSLAQAFVYPLMIAFGVSGMTQVTLFTSETLFFWMATYGLSAAFGCAKSTKNPA